MFNTIAERKLKGNIKRSKTIKFAQKIIKEILEKIFEGNNRIYGFVYTKKNCRKKQKKRLKNSLKHC